MTSDKAMNYAREDIAEMCRSPTHSDCKALHTPIIGYCRALLACGLISAEQEDRLIAEADEGLACWRAGKRP
jgi:hypothetical protein